MYLLNKHIFMQISFLLIQKWRKKQCHCEPHQICSQPFKRRQTHMHKMGAKDRRAENFFQSERKNRSLILYSLYSIGMWLFETIILLYTYRVLCSILMRCVCACVQKYSYAWTWAHVCRCSSFFHHQPPPATSTSSFPTLNFFNC